jgi:ComF family protein
MARAPWGYQGAAEELIRQFKYHRRWRVGRWLAEHMVATANASLPLEEVAAVVPVPLHWLKHRLRGTNPSEELARIIARSLKKPCLTRALRRDRWTRTQTQLGWRERTRNVHGAFIAREPLARNRGLLLVDDVLTSGATANACAHALKQAGAHRVFVLTAARTPLP